MAEFEKIWSVQIGDFKTTIDFDTTEQEGEAYYWATVSFREKQIAKYGDVNIERLKHKSYASIKKAIETSHDALILHREQLPDNPKQTLTISQYEGNSYVPLLKRGVDTCRGSIVNKDNL